MHAYCKSLRILIVLNFLLLVRPGVELEIVLARPDLELVPGVRAMDLSAPGNERLYSVEPHFTVEKMSASS